VAKEVDVAVHEAEGGPEASGSENYKLLLILSSIFLYITFDRDVEKI
jgi:hypothetical protein